VDKTKSIVACPECGARLTVDLATGTVLHHRPAKKARDPGKDFDRLLAGLDESKAHAEDVFQREVSALEDRDRLMEEKFREALRRAEEEPDDEPPLRPWDLD
jgi:hypothetical protein